MSSIRIFSEEYDDTDKKILDLLQNNAKITIKEIAKETGKSPTAVRARVKSLEEVFVKKYAAILDCSKMGYREMVIASIRLNSSETLDETRKQIEAMREIKYAYLVTGEYPIFVMAKCLGHEESLVLIEKLRNLPSVEEINTQLVLDRIKEDHTIIIPE